MLSGQQNRTVLAQRTYITLCYELSTVSHSHQLLNQQASIHRKCVMGRRKVQFTKGDRSDNVLRPTVCKADLHVIYQVPHVWTDTVTWLRWLVALRSLQRSSFDPSPIQVGFMADKVAMRLILLAAFRFCPVSIIPPMFHSHSLTRLFTCH